MSSSACVAYFGLRFDVSVEEIDSLEQRRDARQIAAKGVGLSSYWGNFGGESERYVLLIGTKIAILGVENEVAATLSNQQLSKVMIETVDRLRSANFADGAGLHLEWLSDA
ncbi:hypothetical protein [Sphingopyxis sp. 2PD]|uniref:hypothetical protein n=1 Tax=Sphingopyxis sp. 2PD TaxID=2502196 RepID=UPI0010F6C65E|nr:hypothetical protein [Sphingopyxis sp. 2PD]